MKKIFTLLAVAAMAVTASAQALTWSVPAPEKDEDGKDIPSTAFTPTDGLVVAQDTQCPMEFSADGKWASAKSAKFGDSYPNLKASVQGGNNPKADGAGYKKGDNPNFPTAGCGYIFEPKVNGTLTIYAKLAGGKPSFVVTGEGFADVDAKKADGTPCGKIDTNVDEVKGIDGDGEAILTLSVEGGKKYCLVTEGSKATLYGYNFEASGPSSLNAIVADENAPVEYFNLQGIRVNNPENGLYIRRQGKKVTKVIL